MVSLDDDPTRGLQVDPEDPQSENSRSDAKKETILLRGNMDDFLCCVATYCPSGFYEFVIRESTSLQWIYDQILNVYNLQTKRQDILNGAEMDFKFDDKFTYQHAYIQMKDFYMSALLPKGSIWKGKTLQSAEVLTPLAESLIIEKWLYKIHPLLPAHVKRTRGHLFTSTAPTLGCNQTEICKQIDMMLAEIEKEQDTISVNRISSGNFRPWRNNQQLNSRPRAPQFSSYVRPPPNLRPTYSQQNPFPCQLCLQAGKPEYVARSHLSTQCQSFLPRNRPVVPRNRTPAMRLIAAPVPETTEDAPIDLLAQNDSNTDNLFWDDRHSGDVSDFAYGAPNVPFTNQYSDADFHHVSQQD